MSEVRTDLNFEQHDQLLNWLVKEGLVVQVGGLIEVVGVSETS